MSHDGSPAGPASQADIATVVEELHAYVAYHLGSGLEAFPLGGAPLLQPSLGLPPSEKGDQGGLASRSPQEIPPTPSFSSSSKGGSLVATESDAAGATSLEALRQLIGDCQRCKLCSLGRTQIVFGVGNPQADLMFVGEGPGFDEDRQGEPFVGRAGVLLTDIITKGMKLRREDVYIANVVKCRPPENRDPEPDEIAACRPFLQRQIELVQPKVLVALGRFAAQTMLGVTTPVTRLRGQWHEYRGIKLMPTLHPAYLLRNPADKRLVWEDIQMVMRHLGLLGSP